MLFSQIVNKWNNERYIVLYQQWIAKFIRRQRPLIHACCIYIYPYTSYHPTLNITTCQLFQKTLTGSDLRLVSNLNFLIPDSRTIMRLYFVCIQCVLNPMSRLISRIELILCLYFIPVLGIHQAYVIYGHIIYLMADFLYTHAHIV